MSNENKPDHVSRLRKGVVTVMCSVEVGPGTRVPPFFVRDISAACDEVEALRTKLAEAERLFLLMGYGPDRDRCQDCGWSVEKCEERPGDGDEPCLGILARAFLATTEPEQP